MFFSIIIPTFKRADEVIECLESLTKQTYKEFEIILADGTPGESLEKHTLPYKNKLQLTFLYEEYLGVSEARNLGATVAKGDYFIFLDSDCIFPENYLEKVNESLTKNHLDEFGGPDAAHDSFTVLQKAISYTMTSILTTGGIRGQKKHMGQFHPRGFNMGVSREAFEKVGGYSTFKCGEDIELSIRIIKAGFKVDLIPEAFVYHKRRSTLKQFFNQVYRFGAARINIWSRHKEELKLTHLFPTIFIIGFIKSLALFIISLFFKMQYFTALSNDMTTEMYASRYSFLSLLCAIPLYIYCIYFLILIIHSSMLNKSLKVGIYSFFTCITQMAGYGFGFLANAWEVIVKGNKNGLKL
jgi:GT2 family glycosyltransferase